MGILRLWYEDGTNRFLGYVKNLKELLEKIKNETKPIKTITKEFYIDNQYIREVDYSLEEILEEIEE